MKATSGIISSIVCILTLLSTTGMSQNKGFRFDTPWLGVMVKDVSQKTLKNMGLENGVMITKVYNGSPADKAGLEIEDIIISFAGEKIGDSKELVESVKKSKINENVPIEYLREGDKKSVDVAIKKRKSPEVFMKAKPQILKKKFQSAQNSVFLGVKVEKLSDQLRKYFGVENELGILISEVIKNSPAENAGVRAGDIIIQIAEREVKNYADLIRGLNYFDPGDEVNLVVVRDKSTKSIEVKLGKPENIKSQSLWFDGTNEIHLEIPEMDIEHLENEEIKFKIDDQEKKIEIRKNIIKENEAFFDEAKINRS